MRSTAYSYCEAFVNGRSPFESLDKYFTPHPKIIEHGPSFAKDRLPFLGILFEGRKPPPTSKSTASGTVDDYYYLLSKTLSFHPSKDTLPPKEQFSVDPEQGTVTIKLRGKFASLKTGRDWEEDFVYLLSEFDEHGKIGCQELWADPLSAWMAVGGD